MVMLEGTAERYVQIGSCLQEPLKKDLVNLFKPNLDVFAWSPSDMLGIYPEMITHKLNIRPQSNL